MEFGDILYDDISTKNIDVGVVRKNIFLVLQNTQLLNGTITQNLTFGNSIETEKLDYAVKTSQLSEFIDSLKDGLETNIGRDGIKLSGGQRQRLSIARMIIQDSKYSNF